MDKIKGFFKKLFYDFLSPSPISEKKQLILSIVWLAFSVIFLVLGIVLGIFARIIDSPIFIIRFWYTMSLCCGIMFIPGLFKALIKNIKAAASIGKNITYTSYNEKQVTSHAIEVTKEQKNLGGWFGYIWGVLIFIFQLILMGFLGAILLATKATLVIKEITKYMSDSQTSATESKTC